MRTVQLDPDYRREPRTALHCYVCQRDIAPSRPYWQVAVSLDETWSMLGVHPDDADASTEWHPVGPECARRIGLQWFRQVAIKEAPPP